MRTSYLAALLVLAALCSIAPGQTTWTVDDDGTADFVRISEAITAASSGDRIEVMGGLYLERIDYGSKSLEIVAVDGPDVTTIRSDAADSTVLVTGGQGSETLLEGFSIEGGGATGDSCSHHGLAMYIQSSSPVVRACRFSGFSVQARAGVAVNSGSPWFVECEVLGNTAESYGDFFRVVCGSHVLITRCRFDTNSCGLLFSHLGSSLTVEDSQFTGNRGPAAGSQSFYCYANASITFTRCVLDFSEGYDSEWVITVSGPSPSVVTFSESSAPCFVPSVDVYLFDGGEFVDDGTNDFDCNPCRVDLTGDGLVNTQDVIQFLGLWVLKDSQADWNGDGTVNTLDFLAFLNEWTIGC